MKKTKIKTKAAPAIVWIKGTRPSEWMGFIGVKHVFIITQGYYLYIEEPIEMFVGEYSSSRSAKRGAERFAKRMREIFA